MPFYDSISLNIFLYSRQGLNMVAASNPKIKDTDIGTEDAKSAYYLVLQGFPYNGHEADLESLQRLLNKK